MLGKILGAVAGERASRHFTGIDGPMGAALGAGAISLARRWPLGLLAVAAGGYAVKRYRDRQDRIPTARPPAAPAANKAAAAPPKA